MRFPVIGLTCGDPAGIGPEVVEAALGSGLLPRGFTYQVLGERGGAIPGEPTEKSAREAVRSLEIAARLLAAGKIAGVVTGPIAKHRVQAVGFAFPGQTEFFAARSGTENYAMCLTGGGLTVALVTAHLPLRAVPEALTTAEIVRVGKLLADFLELQLGKVPRIAVAGFNPHAGEAGTMGREEIDVIAPAVAALQAGGHGEFAGPISPDTLFHRALQGAWDGVLCMYHDQGLIPLKMHAFDRGVNVTLGLPFVRTSPDHGTAFEIAGRGLARPESMIAAIQLAAELVARRRG